MPDQFSAKTSKLTDHGSASFLMAWHIKRITLDVTGMSVSQHFCLALES